MITLDKYRFYIYIAIEIKNKMKTRKPGLTIEEHLSTALKENEQLRFRLEIAEKIAYEERQELEKFKEALKRFLKIGETEVEEYFN